MTIENEHSDIEVSAPDEVEAASAPEIVVEPELGHVEVVPDSVADSVEDSVVVDDTAPSTDVVVETVQCDLLDQSPDGETDDSTPVSAEAAPVEVADSSSTDVAPPGHGDVPEETRAEATPEDIAPDDHLDSVTTEPQAEPAAEADVAPEAEADVSPEADLAAHVVASAESAPAVSTAPPAVELDHQPVIGESATSLPTGDHGVPKRPSSPAVQVGRLVEVTVAAIREREVEVKLADGRLGVIPKGDIEGADGRVPGVGDRISAALLAREDPQSRVVLSRSWAAKQEAWDRLERAHKDHTVITGTVQKVVKGGLLVAVGVPAFMPASLVDEHTVEDLSTFVGQELELTVSELDKSAAKVVVNRRDVLRRRRREQEKELYSKIAVGDRVTGTVVSSADYGVLIDVNGVRGLLHRTEMSWGWINNPGDVYAVGDSVEVLITEINKSKKRVSLSVRQLLVDPFSEMKPGRIIDATITRVVEYGAFALIDGTDVEGLVHISEISDVPGYRPEHLVAPGERVVAKVLNVDKKRRRIGLSIRQAVMIDGLD